ncbi:MAG: hypothetical protein N2491_00980 [Negativicutes bacterium]|nr:hypothetical protein [Negativicutes bacterium]
MNFSWYLGFGWGSIILFALFGAGAYYYAEGWLHWLFYAFFAVVAAYMLTRFRLYRSEPWRRVHQRAAIILSDLIKQDGNGKHKPDRIAISRQLAEKLLGSCAAAAINENGTLTDAGRKAYYRELADTYSIVFTRNLPEEKHPEAIKSIMKDIEASEFGPDIVIAVAIEKQYGRLEAARYLLAMASGYAK